MNNTHFLNIDLDIESKQDISELVNELSSGLIQMTYHKYEGIFKASFETGESEIESIILTFVGVVNKLSPSARSFWNQCTKRELNFGYQSELIPKSYENHISQQAIKEIALLNCQIGITIYAPESNFT